MGAYIPLRRPLCRSLTISLVGQAALEADGALSRSDAIALASVNLEKLLGLKKPVSDLVAVKSGSLLDFEGKVVGVISPGRGVVDLL